LYDVDDLEDIVNIVHPVINGIQRIDRVKIINYLEIVSNYSDKDFIMHFRLTRSVAKDLICRFELTHFYNNLKGLIDLYILLNK